MGKHYVSIVTVRVKAPADYRPRISRYKFGYISDVKSASFQTEVKTKCIHVVKEQLEEQNPGVDLVYSATVEINGVAGIMGYSKNVSKG